MAFPSITFYIDSTLARHFNSLVRMGGGFLLESYPPRLDPSGLRSYPPTSFPSSPRLSLSLSILHAG